MKGKQIKEIRLSKGLSQTEFAGILNVSKTTVCLWENDFKSPSPSSIKKLLAYCKENKIKIKG